MPSQRVYSEADEGPQDSDIDRFGGDTRPCPKCGTDLYDEAEWCHKCGHVLTQADTKVPAWVMITAATLIACFALFLIVR